MGADQNGGRCCTGAIDLAKGVCGYASGVGRGDVHGDRACADDEDGRRGEDDLEAMVVLGVANVLRIGALIGLPSCRRASSRRRH